MKKTVLLEIVVPNDNKCFNQNTVCQWFDNEGGGSRCVLSLGTLTYQNDGSVLKPNRCKGLGEVSDER